MIHDWTFPNSGNKAIKQLDETTLLTVQGVTDGAGFVWGIEYLGQVVRSGCTAEAGRNLIEAENASMEYRNYMELDISGARGAIDSAVRDYQYGVLE